MDYIKELENNKAITIKHRKLNTYNLNMIDCIFSQRYDKGIRYVLFCMEFVGADICNMSNINFQFIDALDVDSIMHDAEKGTLDVITLVNKSVVENAYNNAVNSLNMILGAEVIG